MLNKIFNLREKGYVPNIIFDIGAYEGNWTREVLKIYPKRKYLLFEPIEYIELDDLKKKENIKVFHELLNDSNTVVDWYEMQNSGDSMFKERTKDFENCPVYKKKSTTLNSFLEKKKGILENCKNILMKIDCQGAEISVLKGATNILNITDFIIIEIPVFGQYNENVPNFLEHIKFMDDIGFIPYEFLDSHYRNGFNIQVDILFINKNHSFNDLIENLFKNTLFTFYT